MKALKQPWIFLSLCYPRSCYIFPPCLPLLFLSAGVQELSITAFGTQLWPSWLWCCSVLPSEPSFLWVCSTPTQRPVYLTRSSLASTAACASLSPCWPSLHAYRNVSAGTHKHNLRHIKHCVVPISKTVSCNTCSAAHIRPAAARSHQCVRHVPHVLSLHQQTKRKWVWSYTKLYYDHIMTRDAPIRLFRSRYRCQGFVYLSIPNTDPIPLLN